MSDSVGGQIISELGNIAKDIGVQTAKVPGDIAGKAIESMGASGSGKQTGKTVRASVSENGKPATAWEKITQEKDQNIKRHIARKALEELSGGQLRRPKEPSIWERLQAEQEQKKRNDEMNKAALSSQLRVPVSKRPRGDFYGTHAKQTATENRNVRQD